MDLDLTLDGSTLEEVTAIGSEIVAKLSKLKDPQSGEEIFREVFDAERIFTGPYVFQAPDLFMGYKRGYRNSWDCATGACPPETMPDSRISVGKAAAGISPPGWKITNDSSTFLSCRTLPGQS